jgi:hypothetical protein
MLSVERKSAVGLRENDMKPIVRKILSGVALLAIAAPACFASNAGQYRLEIKSQLPESQAVTMRAYGRNLLCNAVAAKGTVQHCSAMTNLPTWVDVTWQSQRDGAVQHSVDFGTLAAPRWFRPGDALVFVIKKNGRAELSFECRPAGDRSCVGVAPRIWPANFGNMAF